MAKQALVAVKTKSRVRGGRVNSSSPNISGDETITDGPDHVLEDFSVSDSHCFGLFIRHHL